MGIFIRRMRLPEIKPNSSIKMELRNLDGEITIGIMTGGYSCCEQWTHYPIAEVKEPHGRLKDADEIVKRINEFEDMDTTSTEKAIGANYCRDFIDNTPTTIEAE